MESARHSVVSSSPPSAGDAHLAALAGEVDHSHVNDEATYTPYWLGSPRNARSVSNASSLGWRNRGQIRLEDHSEESHELSQGCWAKSATVDDYVLVSGVTGMGAYVVWHCIVKTLKGGDLVLRKR